MADRFAETLTAVKAAEANGWHRIEGGKLRRMTEHGTPQFVIDAGWWTNPMYTTCEFMSFVFSSRTRVPKVIYGVSSCPWVGGSDRGISFKAALALLAQPLDQSEIHDRD